MPRLYYSVMMFLGRWKRNGRYCGTGEYGCYFNAIYHIADILAGSSDIHIIMVDGKDVG